MCYQGDWINPGFCRLAKRNVAQNEIVLNIAMLNVSYDCDGYREISSAHFPSSIIAIHRQDTGAKARPC
jgi:hypothetical protein